jgi:acyl carrier protein phosphodiesterase
MNWLAHTFLSAPRIHFQLGNLLADVVRGADRAAMNSEFLRGAECHKAIDAFTDSHPLVMRSRARLGAGYRRFSGVIMDVYYDHLLATYWERYSSESLTAFVSRFYAAAVATPLALPPAAQATLDRIIRHDSLGSYREIEGVHRALRRISIYLRERWRRPVALEECIPELVANQESYAADFLDFFPQLRSHLVPWIADEASS